MSRGVWSILDGQGRLHQEGGHWAGNEIDFEAVRTSWKSLPTRGDRLHYYHHHTRFRWPPVSEISQRSTHTVPPISLAPPHPEPIPCHTPVAVSLRIGLPPLTGLSKHAYIADSGLPSTSKISKRPDPPARNSHQHHHERASILHRHPQATLPIENQSPRHHNATSITSRRVPHPARPRQALGNIRFDEKRMSRPPMI